MAPAVTRRAVATGVALAVLLLARRAAAEPEAPTQITVPVTCTDDAQPPHTLRLAPGFYLTESAWDNLDLQVKRLQEDRTRLTAENQSLRESGGTPSWWWVAAGLVAGAAGGFWVGSRL